MSILFLFIFAGWIIYYTREHYQDFSIIHNVALLPIAILWLVILVETFVSGLFTKVVMQHFKIKLRFNEWYGLSIITRFWNTILPLRGGAGVRALYLKKMYEFPISEFFAALASLYILIFLVNSAIGIICIISLYLLSNILIYTLFLFFLSVFLLMNVFIFSPFRIPESRYALLSKLSKIIDAWHGIRTNYHLIKKLLWVTILNSSVGLFTVYFSYHSFGINLSIFQSLLISTLFNFTVMINITPGSLGIVESIMILTANLFGINPAESLMASALIRTVHMLLVFILGILFNYRLGLNIRNHIAANNV